MTNGETKKWIDMLIDYSLEFDGVGQDEHDKAVEALGVAVKLLERTRWVPVSERLPEDGTWNIWQSTTGALSIERYKEDAYNHFYPSGRFFSLEDAIAWMPLPERYKEEANEKNN